MLDKKHKSLKKKDINPIEALIDGGLELIQAEDEKKSVKEEEESIKVTFTVPASLFAEMEHHIYKEKLKRRKLTDKIRGKEKIISKSGYISFAIEETLKREGYYSS